jgi:4-oxalocrotonate tautomerase
MPIIKVEMLKGRSVEQKRAIARELTQGFVRACGVKPESIWIVMDEVDKENWAAGGELLSDKSP